MGRKPALLLVANNERQTRKLTETLARRALPHPAHVQRGEEAVLWVAEHSCDVCVVDYDLPGIDGVETVVRLHERKPELPIVMISDARSERVAVAAFRASVVDYVPKAAGFDTRVADIVDHYAMERSHTAPLPPVVPDDIPAGLGAPTYQNRLRVIGRQLDLYAYTAINISEVGGGFIVRALPQGSRLPQALEFTDRDFPHLVRSTIQARGERDRPRASNSLLPTGYEDFLRALGHRLDTKGAMAITVTELGQSIAVGGVAPLSGYRDVTMEPFHMMARPDDVARLVDEAYRRRASATKALFTRLIRA